jgi:hypothetical protein
VPFANHTHLNDVACKVITTSRFNTHHVNIIIIGTAYHSSHFYSSDQHCSLQFLPSPLSLLPPSAVSIPPLTPLPSPSFCSINSSTQPSLLSFAFVPQELLSPASNKGIELLDYPTFNPRVKGRHYRFFYAIAPRSLTTSRWYGPHLSYYAGTIHISCD